MKSLLCTAMAALALANPVWAHESHPAHAPEAGHSHTPAASAPGAKLDAHTQEDVVRHRSMARALEQAAQCLAQGRKFDDCQKQLQAACKGLALGKNCGMRHAH
ncbi:MAG: hypothetical protein KBT18_04850 [Comamonas sp.]|nr:hypothetical protein [Candidatus Comamonas equi]